MSRRRHAGQVANDLLKILDREVVIDDVITSDQDPDAKFGSYEWWWQDGKTYIHLYNGEVQPGEGTWACFNFHCSDIVGVIKVIWTYDGVPIDDSGPPVGGGSVFVGEQMSLEFRNDWEPEFWAPHLIFVTELRIATTDTPFPLVDLDEEILDHPDLDWVSYADLVLDSGETQDLYLGIPPYDMYVLVSFVAVHANQTWFQVHEIWQIPTWPTVDPCPVEDTSWSKIKNMYR